MSTFFPPGEVIREELVHVKRISNRLTFSFVHQEPSRGHKLLHLTTDKYLRMLIKALKWLFYAFESHCHWKVKHSFNSPRNNWGRKLLHSVYSELDLLTCVNLLFLLYFLLLYLNILTQLLSFIYLFAYWFHILFLLIYFIHVHYFTNFTFFIYLLGLTYLFLFTWPFSISYLTDFTTFTFFIYLLAHLDFLTCSVYFSYFTYFI